MFERIIGLHLDLWKMDKRRKPLYAAATLAHEKQGEALTSLLSVDPHSVFS